MRHGVLRRTEGKTGLIAFRPRLIFRPWAYSKRSITSKHTGIVCDNIIAICCHFSFKHQPLVYFYQRFFFSEFDNSLCIMICMHAFNILLQACVKMFSKLKKGTFRRILDYCAHPSLSFRLATTASCVDFQC